MFKRLTFVVLAVLLLLAAAVGVNTLRQGSRQVDVPASTPVAVDERAIAEKLAGAVRFRTVSSLEDPGLNRDEFLHLHEYLQQRFPRVHATLKREIVNGLSLLYTWQGQDPASRPIVLMAHQDVVPIEPGTEQKWEAPPFAGEIRGGYVWGRGTWDDKGNLLAQMEAIEMLLASGFQPRQTVYIASGADEEVGGLRGAAQIARLLGERNVKPDFVVDEGLFIGQGFINGIDKPLALVGMAEKGYLSVMLTANGTAGHGSAPPTHHDSAISLMSAALLRLDEHQLPAALRGIARESFETLAPEMHGFQRIALSNLWLFGRMVQSQLEKSPSMNAMLRTTTAFTVFQAGNKDNVIPGQANAVVNFRIIPGETRETVLKHVRSHVGERVFVKTLDGNSDPTSESPTSAAPYQMLQRTLRSMDPNVLVLPALYTAGSDSRHFVGLTSNIYRFTPMRMKVEDLPRIHGTNERIATANLAELVRFYHLLLRNASQLPASPTVSS